MKISVIIPTLNRANYLEKALSSLIVQTLSPDYYEIIVVDNGSIDDTQKLVNKYIQDYKKHTIRYIYDDIPGLLTGRHRGAKAAQAELLCFLDDDIEATPELLEQVVITFDDSSIHLVGGKCLPIYDVPPPVWEKELWDFTSDYKLCVYYSLIDQGEKFKDCDPNLIWGLFFCIRKKTLYDAGGFHPDCLPLKLMRFMGDGETGLTMRIKEMGLRSVYQPRAVLYHHVTKERLNLSYLKKRSFYQGCCDSYSMIRRNCGFEKQEIVSVLTLHRKFIINVFLLFIKILKLLFLLRFRLIRFEVILFEIDKSYNSGYAFHQNEAIKDVDLVKWFLKSDYFDYRLPGKY